MKASDTEVLISRNEFEEIKRLKERYELAMEAIGEGLWEISIPDNLEIEEDTPIWYSGKFVELLGFEPEEFAPVIKSWSDRIHPSQKKEVFGYYSNFIKGQEDFYEIETLLKTKNGQYRWFRERARIIRDKNGKPAREAGSLLDIHEEKLLRIKEEEAHLRQQMAITIAKQAYWEWSFKDHYSYSYNFFELLGYENPSQNLNFSTWLTLLHPEDRVRTECYYKEILKGPVNDYRDEYRLRHQNGNYQWYLSVAKVINRDEKGQAIQVAGVIMNIDEKKRFEKEILRHKNRLELALKVAGACVWEWDEDENELFLYNFFELIGLEEKQGFNFQKWAELLHPDDKEKTKNLISDALKTKTEFSSTHRLLTKNEGYKWFLSVAHITEINQNNRIKKISGILMDMNDKKNIEIALEENEEKYRILIEESPACIVIYDEQFQILYVNPEVLRRYGYTYEELIRFKLFRMIHPDVQEEVRERIERRIVGEEFLNRYDLKTITKQGEVIWMDTSTSTTFLQGKKIFFATGYDITQRRKVENDLKTSNDSLKATEEELRQNAEELSAINENLQKIKWQLEKSLENEKNAGAKIEKKNHLLFLQKRELKNTIHQLKKAQQQLIQSEKMASLGVLVAGVAHEINNPVNYIGSSCEALKSYLQDILNLLALYKTLEPENVREKLLEINNEKQKMDFEQLVQEAEVLLKNISEGAEQTAEIVRGLRSFSRMDRGIKEKIHLHEILDSCLVILHPEYKFNIQITKIYGELPLFDVYPNQLSQVFMNLLMNAIQSINDKSSDATGNIFIRTYTTQSDNLSYVAIEIEDDGRGIPEEIQRRIFEPFFTTKELGKGTGLGLPISLGLVENHHGKIEFESELNVGTKFIISLPTNT